MTPLYSFTCELTIGSETTDVGKLINQNGWVSRWQGHCIELLRPDEIRYGDLIMAAKPEGGPAKAARVVEIACHTDSWVTRPRVLVLENQDKVRTPMELAPTATLLVYDLAAGAATPRRIRDVVMQDIVWHAAANEYAHVIQL